jgi:hypothetical protein
MHGNTISKSYRISILYPWNIICSFGGGGVAALTFLCKTSWKNSILFLKAFAEYKKTKQLDRNISLYIRNTIPVLYIYIITPTLHWKHSNFKKKRVEKRAKISVNILCNKRCFESSCVLIKNICQQKITYSSPKHCQ